MKKKKIAKKATKKISSSQSDRVRNVKPTETISLRKSTQKIIGSVFESTPTSMADLKILGLKVLERAKQMSESLRNAKTDSAKEPKKVKSKANPLKRGPSRK